MAPQLLVAETEEGDYAFLDMTRPAFDLSDRGVTGRPDQPVLSTCSRPPSAVSIARANPSS